ncbi:metallophosphoesterase family protein [Bradyrhizobium sp. LHD-71]|uniref:metallophosphoesterase family protein n=1 Tax=Bradyrhizobium sp. LHD-71 TaxID=3072141 RepID=UPI00280CC4B4|nr:metallophosphoesterase family protein [Bradyrhizobium sp. LHD-71]MDQ8729776.1 metallophosphoesterase family protein [Bradyrhizobium sp. LHD-71]
MGRSGAPGTTAWRSRVPPATRVYAVGDIHGRADLLFDVVQRIDDDLRRRPVKYAIEIYLGDYIDRGSDSKTVIDILCRRLVYRNAVCLRGNHEALLEDFLHDPDVIYDWRRLGGLNTINSYGVALPAMAQLVPSELHRDFCSVLPRTHLLFLQCLQNIYWCGDYLFVHAGIRPGVPIEYQVENDLFWIRQEFLQSKADHGWTVVHGHTPVIHPYVSSNRINIDTGAVHTGKLTCLVLEAAAVSFL